MILVVYSELERIGEYLSDVQRWSGMCTILTSNLSASMSQYMAFFLFVSPG